MHITHTFSQLDMPITIHLIITLEN